jgi:hypothetical protein
MQLFGNAEWLEPGFPMLAVVAFFATTVYQRHGSCQVFLDNSLPVSSNGMALDRFRDIYTK